MRATLLLKPTALGLAVFVLATVCINLSRVSDNIAFVWLSNILAIACVARSPTKQWLRLLIAAFVGNFAANLLHGDPLAASLSLCLANVVEVWGGAWLLTRSKEPTWIYANVHRALRTLTILILAGAPLGAAVAVLIASPHFAAPWTGFFANWWLGETAGSLLLAIPAFSISLAQLREACRPRELARLCVWVLGMTAWMGLVVENFPFPFVYIAAPLTVIALRDGALRLTLVATFSALGFCGLLALEMIEVPFGLLQNSAKHIWSAAALCCTFPLLMGVASDQMRERNRGLARSEARFRNALHGASSGFAILDETHLVVDVNPALCKTLGFEARELLHATLRSFMQEAAAELSQPLFAALWSRAALSFSRELCFVHKSGRIVWTQTRASILDPGAQEIQLLVQIEDITAHKHDQQALQEVKNRLQGVIDSASEFSIIATDTRGIIEVFNVGAERMTGYQAAEMIGIHTPVILHDRGEIQAFSQEAVARGGQPIDTLDMFNHEVGQSGTIAHEWTYIRKDGSRLLVALVNSAIRNSSGDITGYLGIAQDVTAVRQAKQVLQDAKEQAELASRSKSEFVANMSHEIRTPLNAVLGMAQVLAGTDLSPTQQRYTEMIRLSGQSLLALINDILDFSKIEAGRMDLISVPFALDDLMQGCATIMAAAAREKDLHLRILIDHDVPGHLIGDALRLQQVLINLASNAIKFTEAGEVSLHIACEAVQQSQVRLRFAVHDTGIGMDEAAQSRLFQTFSQVDGSITRRFGGTGLGLAICKRLVALMGGEIGATSQLGQGSDFWFSASFECTSATDTVREDAPTPHSMVHGRSLWLCSENADMASDLQAHALRLGVAIEHVTLNQALAASRPKSPSDRTSVEAVVFALSPARWQVLSQHLATVPSDDSTRVPVVLCLSAFTYDWLCGAHPLAADAILLQPVCSNNLALSLAQALRLQRNIPTQSARELQGMHLLLVEDNVLNQSVARGLLELRGATLEIVDNGRAAVEHLRIHAHRFALVLMDVQMPIMDGFSATQAIRHQLGLQLPIVAMSAGVTAAERERCTAAGMNDFVGKPIDLNELVAVILRNVTVRSPTAVSPPLGLSPAVPTSAALPAAAPPEITFDDGLDPDALLETLAGSEELRDSIIAQFVSSYVDMLDRLQASLASDNVGDAMRLCHTLRGTAGMLRARGLQQAAAAAERIFDTNEREHFDLALANLAQALAPQLEFAQAWLAWRNQQAA